MPRAQHSTAVPRILRHRLWVSSVAGPQGSFAGADKGTKRTAAHGPQVTEDRNPNWALSRGVTKPGSLCQVDTRV